MDITSPASAYLFLSDDAMNGITGSDKKRIKCLSCGYRFRARYTTGARNVSALIPKK